MADGEKTELASDRTDLAEDRTVLANERTFAGWMRTGFAAIGIGLGFNVLFRELDPVWVPKAIATIFLLIAIFIFVAAEHRARAVIERLDTHQVKGFKRINLRLMTWATVLATIALIVGIWTLA